MIQAEQLCDHASELPRLPANQPFQLFFRSLIFGRSEALEDSADHRQSCGSIQLGLCLSLPFEPPRTTRSTHSVPTLPSPRIIILGRSTLSMCSSIFARMQYKSILFCLTFNTVALLLLIYQLLSSVSCCKGEPEYRKRPCIRMDGVTW